jgi:hypothetical protein
MTNPKEYPHLISPHGGYRNLQSYQMAEIVFDGTAAFCDRYIDRWSRTQIRCYRLGAASHAFGGTGDSMTAGMEEGGFTGRLMFMEALK